MGVWVFYLIAMLPLCVGGYLFIRSKEVNWQEWLISSAVTFLLAGLMHWLAIAGMTMDKETQSGHIVRSREYSAWQEYYEEAIYRTEYYTTTSYSNGKMRTHRKSRRVFSHWSPRRRWHNIHWTAYSNIDTSHSINQDYHKYFEGKFADRHPVPGDRRTLEHASRMIGGDPNDYVADNRTGWIEPVTKQVAFENRIKAAPSVFSFVKPPAGSVFPYPKNEDPFHSDRLIGTATSIDRFAFDQMNARLGPTKKVNVLMIGFGDKGSEYSQMQQAEYIGGKKNDIVICFGGPNEKPTWSFVFGWTEKDITKRALESIILKHGALTSTLTVIEREIAANYVLKDWKKFDYIQVTPPTWSYVVFFFLLVAIHGGFWYWALRNGHTK